MTDEKIKEFKQELAQLLIKYDVCIAFTCGECCDTQGFYDDKVVIQDNKTRENIVEADSWWLFAEDLK